MSRPLRIEFAGAVYHVTSRGDRREAIFEDDEDREALLAVLELGLERFGATLFAYCLMGNHYHFVVQTHQPNLSRLMRHINGVYTQTYNRRHRKVGHLFQGRFKAVLVDRGAYFLEVCRYVDLNPVRAGMVRHPRDWRHSSYRAHAGESSVPDWLDSPSLHRHLAPRAPRRDGPIRYAKFVSEGRGVALWETGLRAQIYLGGEAFVERMQALAEPTDDREVPRAQRRTAVQPLTWYLAQHERDTGIALAYLEGGHTQTAIAAATSLSISRVSRVIAARGREAKGKT